MRRIQVTKVFRRTVDAKTTVVVNRGGARSTKSYSLAQLIIYRLTNEHNKSMLICRKTMPSLKITAYKTLVDLLKLYGYYKYCEHNRTTNTLVYTPTNSYILFSSIDDPEKIKSTEFNYIWMEEATDFTLNDYTILKLRLSAQNDLQNHMYLTFNPVSAFHWIKTEIVDKTDDVTEIVSTYRDNPFLSKQYVDLLLDMKEKDPNIWKIYGLGEWGVLDNIIYSNWSEVDKLPPPQRTIYGCDFGFVNPTAIVECRLTDDGIYLNEVLYKTGLTNLELIEYIKLNLPKGSIIYADSAEPARLAEMKRSGLNVLPADKGKNSVKDGIDFIKNKKLYIRSHSVNLLKEIRSYCYKTDRNNNSLEEPVKFNDHCFVAGTKVDTIDGEVNIENLQVGELVLTTGGYKKVLKKWDNGLQEVNDYLIGNNKITCTPGHEFITNLGKVPIGELNTQHTLFMKEGTRCQNKLNLMELPIEGIQIQKEGAIKFITGAPVTITNLDSGIYTGTNTYTIMEKFQKVTTCIIKMVIRLTMKLRISLRLKAVNTFHNIVKNTIRKIKTKLIDTWKGSDHLLRNGTAVRKGESGTPNMVRNPGVVGERLERSVKIVEMNSKPKHTPNNTVQTNASRQIEGSQELITKQEYASNVAKNSPSTDTQKLSAVQTGVPRSIGGTRKEMVYNITVEGKHEYFANNVLVGNCLDALRYAIYTHLGKAKKVGITI